MQWTDAFQHLLSAANYIHAVSHVSPGLTMAARLQPVAVSIIRVGGRIRRRGLSLRRFTRLTNAFSKKLENHAAKVSLYFMYYNVGRVNQTLRVTPAMEAGIADHVWAIEEMAGLLE